VSPFVVNVAELLRRPGNQLELSRSVPAAGLRVVDTVVPDGAPIDVELTLESLSDGIVVTGHIASRWEGACRRCLDSVGGPLEVQVRELYQQRPEADDAFSFRGEHLDLEPMVREALLLELPLAPLCRPDCAGLCPVCGANRDAADCGHLAPVADSRWAALDDLLEAGRLDPPAE
jgi:uncharacterized protein